MIENIKMINAYMHRYVVYLDEWLNDECVYGR